MKSDVDKAGLSYALIAFAMFSFFTVMVYSLLTPVVEYMLDFSLSMSSSSYSETGIGHVQTMWDYWPVWFALIAITFIFIRAKLESRQNGGI